MELPEIQNILHIIFELKFQLARGLSRTPAKILDEELLTISYCCNALYLDV